MNIYNEALDKSVQEIYGNRVRVRICGICEEAGRILLVNHAGLSKGPFWAPPGGGMEFGESAVEALEREFLEETGLRVSVGPLLFVTEFNQPPLHAVEMFFRVTATGGVLKTGSDPEHLVTIQEVRFLTTTQIDALPADAKHGLFSRAASSGQIGALNGYFRI